MKNYSREFSRFLLIVLMSFFTFISHAGIYKWVDENGKVHFSDKRPPINTQSNEVIEIEKNDNNSKFSSVKNASPIRNKNSEKSKSVSLEHVSIDYNGASDDINVGENHMYTDVAKKIIRSLVNNNGKITSALSCMNDGDVKLRNVKAIAKYSDFGVRFFEVFDEYGYETVKSEKKFALQNSENSDLSLAATIVDVRVDSCGSTRNIISNGLSQNSTYIEVKWEIFDNLTRQILFTTKSKGIDDHIRKKPRKYGAKLSMELAFKNSVEQLLSQEDFSQVLSQGLSENRKFIDMPENVSLEFGSGNDVFSNKIDMIKLASATIRTKSGHGSGFLISSDGYVLTNSHVIGSSENVLIILDGNKYPANVLRNNFVRDISLLKINNLDFIKPLYLSGRKLNIGEEVYVVGTPLNEDLNFSITKGIVSAERVNNGQNYYQTDAAVNPGNSGGPVFNSSGDVVGVTVSGIFTKSGASTNINYFIPIRDAVVALGIDYN